MDKKSIEKLKRDLLKNKSHDIFNNVQALFSLAYSTSDMELCFKVREICAKKSIKFKTECPEHAEKYRQLYRKSLLKAAPYRLRWLLPIFRVEKGRCSTALEENS